MKRTELLATIMAERTRLEQTLASITETQMCQPGVLGQLSVKDIVGHIAQWERRLIGWLETAAAGQTPEVPAPGVTWDDISQLDIQSFRENRNRSANEMLAEFDAVFKRLWQQLETLPEFEDVDHKYWSVWKDNKPIDLISNNTYVHYREHLEPIQAWLETR